jgi:parallel beta-helix repeat protein
MQLAGVLVSNYPLNNPQLPQNNTINENTFQGNHWAIDLQNSTLNTFYHNDFFLNGSLRHVNLVAPSATSPNYWDNGTLGGRVGGNYWDNYAGVDTDNDGVGDTSLPSNGVDQRPLMTPFLPVPIFIQAILASPSRGSAPFTVRLSAQTMGTLTPFSYQWSFGDGSPGAAVANLTHTYGQPGNYNVSLTVKDSSGTTDSSTLTIVVSVPSNPSYTLPVIVGVLVVAGIGGFLLWRRRKLRRVKVAERKN